MKPTVAGIYRMLCLLLFIAGPIISFAQDPSGKPGVNIIITQSPKIIVKVAAVSHNVCNGDKKGAINIEPSGGYPPYKYHWTHGDTSQDVAALRAGKYKVAVYDGFSCSDTVEVEIKEPVKLEGKVLRTNDILCYGYKTGEVDIAVTGGKTPYTYNWSNGARSEDLRNVNSGRYSVLITDANACQEIISADVLEKPLIVRSLDDVTNIKCAGEESGKIDISVGGGVPPYSYQWNNGSTAEDLSSLKAGVYEVVVKDSKGCTEVSSTKVIEPAALKVSFDEIKNLRCNGDQGGSININVIGGKQPYNYAWNNGATTQDISGVAAGDYQVRITDANGCINESKSKVTQPEVLKVSLAGTKDIVVNGGKNGAIDIAVTGGLAPYKYKWNTGTESQDLNALGAGAYSVRVTDAAGCAKILNASLVQPPPLIVQLDNVVQIPCNGNQSGEINVSVAGGAPPYIYTWNNGKATEDLSGLGVGNYTLTVADKNGITKQVSATISQPTVLKAQVISTANINCYGNSNGSIDIKVEGGTQPYRYRWSNGQVSQDLINVPVGDYSVKIIDGNGCEVDVAATLSQPEPLKLMFANTQDVACFGQSSGSIDLTTTGGVAPYKFKWNTGQVTEDLKGLKTGVYNVFATDSKGCTQNISTTINEPRILTLSEASSKNVDCKGNSTGAVAVNITGGVGGFKYVWSSGDTSQNLSNLKAGNYSLRVTDKNGCSASFAKVVTEPAKLVRQLDGIANNKCFGDSKGAINISVSGGVTPYNYRWSNGASTQDIVNIKAGKYTVQIRDVNNCLDSLTAVIKENTPVLAKAAPSDIKCFGQKSGLVNVSVSGGVKPYKYSWSNGLKTEDLTGLAAGVYAVSVTDSVGCNVTVDAQVLEPPKLVSSLQAYSDINCNNEKTGSASVRVTGGTLPYKFKWNTGDTTLALKGIGAGTYSFSVIDAAGCSESLKATLSQPTAMDNLIKAVNNISCFNEKAGSIDIAVSGGVGPYSYKWSNGLTTQDLEDVGAGKYSVAITDSKGCVKNLSAEIFQPTELIAKLDTIISIRCFGEKTGAVNISVSGGVAPYKYLWSNGATTQDVSLLPSGQYSVTITDSKGCIKTINATVAQPPQFVAKLGEVKNINCFGDRDGAILINVTGGVMPYTFKWSNGGTAQNLSSVPAGNYSVLITDANGCTQSLAAVISQPTKLVSSVLGVRNVNCFGDAAGSVSVSVVGGTHPYSYSWSNGATTRDLSMVKAGNYRLTIKDARGCTDSLVNVTIKEPPLMELTLVKAVNIMQYGLSTGSIDVNVTGGVLPYKYSWSNGAVTQDISGIPGGDFSLKVTDASGCEKIIQTTITQPPPLLAKLNVVQDLKCATDKNGSVSINVSGGVPPYQYLWSNGATTQNLEGVSAGDYSVTITDANGHKQILGAKIAQPAAIVSKIGLLRNLLCNNDNTGEVQVTVSGGVMPYQFKWNNGKTSEDLIRVPAGEYQLEVTDAAGCKNTLTANVTQPEPFISKIVSLKDVTCKGERQGTVITEATGGVMPYRYTWSNGDRSKDLTAVLAGNYTLRVSDSNGCLQTVEAIVKQPEELLATVSNLMNNNCFGESKGKVQVAVTGGSQPYKYLWNTGDSSKSISNLPTGDYSMKVTDKFGCSKTVITKVTGAPLLDAKLREVINVKCFSDKTGSAFVDVSGGTQPYQFSWNNGVNTQNLTAAASGDYQLSITDSKGCIKTVAAKIAQPLALAISMDTIHNIKCYGQNKGLVDISVSGGIQPYNFVWSNGSTVEDLVNTTAGNYSVKVKDANGCVTSMNAVINEPARLNVGVDSLVMVACSGQESGKILVHGTGGVQPYNYLWNNGSSSPRIAKIPAGEYSLTMTDANGCKALYSANITQPRKLIKAIDAITDVRCYGENYGAIYVTVLEGIAPYTFKWNTGSTAEDLTDLSPGNYSLTVTEANGCKSTIDATIEGPPAFNVAIAGTTDIKCAGDLTGSVDLNVDGGVKPYVIAWSNGAKSEDLKNVRADSYTAMVTDANGCLRTLHTSINEPSKLTLHIDSTRNVKCCGDASGAIFISVTGGVKPYAYQWSNGSTKEDLTNLTLGVYTVNVTDGNGCVVRTPDDMTLYEQVVSKGMFTTRDILFDVAKATIKPQSFTTINKIATFMKEHPDITFRIEGHTDSDGDAAANQKLSEDRAEAIRQALIKFGIRENRLQSRGFGESKPIATNLTAEGKSQNRRVEFITLTGTLEGDLKSTGFKQTLE